MNRQPPLFRHRHSVVIGAVVWLAAAALAPAQASAQTLRVGLLGETDTLDPAKSGSEYAGEILAQLFTALTQYGADGLLGPAAAQSWTVSADGLTYRFALRSDIKWSDGKPVTADDWVWSFRHVVDPKTLAEKAVQYFEIAGAEAANHGKAPLAAIGVKALDAKTLEIRLAAPDPYFPDLLASFFPEPRQAIEAHGNDWVRPQYYVSNGPYKLAASEPNVGVDLARNPYAPADLAPNFDNARVVFITDQAQSLQRYLAGDIDLVVRLQPPEYNRIAEARRGERHAFPSGIVNFLTFNKNRPPLNDARVREALSLAIDRDIIAEKLVGAGAAASNVIVPAEWTGITGQRPPLELSQARPQRLALAQSLLKQAGFGPDKQPKIEIVYSGELRERVAIALRGMWQAIGVDVALRGTEVTGMYSSINSGDYFVGIVRFTMDPIKDPRYLLTQFVHGGRMNFDKIGVPEFDMVLKQASEEPDPARRAGLMTAAESVLLQDWSVVPLYDEPSHYLISPALSGWQPRAAPLQWRVLSTATVAGDR